jgi:hypothetical protein
MIEGASTHLAVSAIAILLPWLLPVLLVALQSRAGWLLVLPGSMVLLPLDGVVRVDSFLGLLISLAATALMIGLAFAVARLNVALLGAVALLMGWASFSFATVLAR